MLRHERSAPIWLFSFVDLAFLLLIAFTQIGSQASPAALTIASLEVPRLLGPAEPLEHEASEPVWQLRVLPLPNPAEDGSAHAPYHLIEPGTAPEGTIAFDATTLSQSLETLAIRRTPKPILVPHRDARAEDLLVALALLEERFAAPRAVAVRPGAADPDVAAQARPAAADRDVTARVRLAR